ncbi:MAG: DUF1007 family protein [Spirochaetales bacterium]|nr:DUF1007 family protein [Spirochaetales bacterium]
MKRIIFFILFTTLPLLCLFAHPHVYIDLCLALEFDEQGLTGFSEQWTILRTFGQTLGPVYDKNSDGIFSLEETKKIKEEVFDNIIKYNYYTYLDVNGVTCFPANVENFSVEMVGDKISFSFFVPCRIYAEEDYQTYELTVHDISRYVSFGLMYIDDPYSKAIDYDIHIERDGDYYSHSCDFGNAVIFLEMKLAKVSEVDLSSKHIAVPDGLIRMTSQNISPRDTITNPFIKPGMRIKDDNPNPFISY